MNKSYLNKLVGSIIKERGVDAVYIFGSRATGKHRPYSDTDICVITGEDANPLRILANASRSIDTSIFWDLPIPVRYRVFKDGRALFTKNIRNVKRIEVDTVLRYLDFKPVLDRHAEIIIGG